MAAPRSLNTILLKLFRFNQVSSVGHEEGSQSGHRCSASKKLDASWARAVGYGQLSFGEHPAKRALYFFAVPSRVIPVNRALQAVAEEHFWLPSKEFFRQGVIGDAIQGTRGHVGLQFYIGLVSGEFANHFRGIDNLDAFHRAQIDRRTVIDFFTSENRALDDVLNVRPIADLRSFAPHFEGILSKEGARNHGDDGMIFDAARPVNREVATGSRSHAVFL